MGRRENQRSVSHSPQISLQDYGMRFLVKSGWTDSRHRSVLAKEESKSVTVNSDKTDLCYFTIPGVYSKIDNLFHTKDYLPLLVHTAASSSKEKRQAHFTSMAKSSKQTIDVSPHEVQITGNC